MKKLVIILSFFSLAATCQDKQSAKSEKDAKNPCDPDIMCTMEFKIIKLEVVYPDGEAVILDDFYTSFNDFEVRVDDDVYESKPGVYPVATDGQMEKLSFEGEQANFIGIKDGQKIIKHPMTIGKDCCHIQLIEGKEKIVVDR